jgi:hypothetical protein
VRRALCESKAFPLAGVVRSSPPILALALAYAWQSTAICGYLSPSSCSAVFYEKGRTFARLIP